MLFEKTRTRLFSGNLKLLEQTSNVTTFNENVVDSTNFQGLYSLNWSIR